MNARRAELERRLRALDPQPTIPDWKQRPAAWARHVKERTVKPAGV